MKEKSIDAIKKEVGYKKRRLVWRPEIGKLFKDVYEHEQARRREIRKARLSDDIIGL